MLAVKLSRTPGIFGSTTQVEIRLEADPLEIDTIPQRLIFTKDDWHESQTVRVALNSGSRVDARNTRLVMRVIAENSDDSYSTVTQSIDIDIQGKPKPLGLTDISLLEGTQHTFNLRLSAPPSTVPITLIPVSDPPKRLTFMPTTLTFTQENGFMQTLTVSSSIDLLSADNQPFILSFQDTEKLVAPTTATITLTDNGQTAGFVIADANTRLRENNNLILIFGETYPLTVHLQGQANTPVVLNINNHLLERGSNNTNTAYLYTTKLEQPSTVSYQITPFYSYAKSPFN